MTSRKRTNVPRGNDPRRCTGTARSTGKRCKRWALKGRNQCRRHGGKALRGPAHPNWKTGERSIVLPARMREDYEAAINDPKRYTFHRNLGRLEAIAAEIARKLDQGNTVAQWTYALGQLTDAHAQSQAGNLDGMLVSFNRAWTALREGGEQERAQEPLRKQMVEILVEIRRTVESEIRRQHSERALITKEQMTALQARLVEIITKHVRDRDALSGIADDFEKEATRFLGPQALDN